MGKQDLVKLTASRFRPNGTYLFRKVILSKRAIVEGT